MLLITAGSRQGKFKQVHFTNNGAPVTSGLGDVTYESTLVIWFNYLTHLLPLLLLSKLQAMLRTMIPTRSRLLARSNRLCLSARLLPCSP